jgi:hypothetical protein
MPAKDQLVGSVIESDCRRCQDRTGHTVVSMVDGQVAKVECRVCGSLHKHRSKKAASAKSSSGPKKRTGKSAQQEPPPIDPEWQRLVSGQAAEQARDYSMNASFQPEELVQHKHFGLGQVQRFIHPNMIDVLFQCGLKRLRCAPAKDGQQ